MKMNKGTLLLSTLLATSTAFAGGVDVEVIPEVKSAPYWEFLLMGGIAAFDMDDTTLRITEFESNNLHQTHRNYWDAWSIQAGIGYVMPLFGSEYYSENWQWFPSIEPQLNVYYTEGRLYGDIYSTPNFIWQDNLEYWMRAKSTRVMLDAAVTVASVRNLSLYAIGGVGPAWNRVSFHRYPLWWITGLNLEEDLNSHFAYELGAGLTFTLGEQVAISLEYLYTHFGNVDLGNNEEPRDWRVTGMGSQNIDLSAQTLLLGFRFAFR